MCCLDTKNRPTLISIEILNSALVYPREVFKIGILSNAASIILAHNHPLGDTTPSNEDISLTNRIKEVCNIIGIKLLDHLIIGQGGYLSLKEEGIIQ